MGQVLRSSTLRLRSPFGQTFCIALVLFSFLLIASEALVRTDQFQSRVINPEMGSRHRQFVIQLNRLNNIVAEEGSIDCIVLGNSMVWLGFDPQAFQKAFQSRAGQGLRCFNFGVDGMPAVSAGALARILAQDYQPRLLIYGTDARDYAVSKEARDAAVLLDMPWVKYRLGKFSVEGWLYEHSYLYRYRKTLRKLLQFDYRTTLRSRNFESNIATRYGFDPDPKVATYIKIPPAQYEQTGHVKYYFDLLSDYRIFPEDFYGLEQILSLNSSVLQVIVIEMPVPDTYLGFFGNEKKDYQLFIEQVGGFSKSKQVPFWQTTPLKLIPDDGWVDYSHLNTNGARIFSEWLGKKVGEAVAQGIISNPILQAKR